MKLIGGRATLGLLPARRVSCFSDQSRMNESEWNKFLTEYNRELWSYEEVVESLLCETINSGWLGYAGASEKELAIVCRTTRIARSHNSGTLRIRTSSPRLLWRFLRPKCRPVTQYFTFSHFLDDALARMASQIASSLCPSSKVLKSISLLAPAT